MTASRSEDLSLSSRVDVSCSEGMIRLRDQEVFGAGLAGQCTYFLHQVFTLSEVTWVEIDPYRSTARIRYEAGRFRLAEVLRRLAVALRDALPPNANGSSQFLSRDLENPTGPLRIHRFGATFTTWDVVCNRPGRIRLRHQALRRNQALATRLHHIIANIPGVIECTIRSLTGSVLIRFDPELTNALYLLWVLDQIRHTSEPLDAISPGAESARFGLANTSLALAVAGETVAPFLLPVSAVLLIGTNVHTFRAAGQQLYRGRLGLPVLYTSIVAATLASGQFIASAAMSWMLVFWGCRYRSNLASAQRRLFGHITHQSRRVKLAASKADGFDAEVLIEDLKSSDAIVVSAGERVPVDGRIRHGRALVDERTIRGLDGLSRKQPHDRVFAGSTIRLGELHIEVLRHGPETLAATLACVMLDATRAPHESQPPNLCGNTFAERIVAPTMAVAGLGLLIGDVSTAGAILRPDYATGPGAAFPLETLQAIAVCLHHGILIQNPEAIERLTTADLLVIEHHPALEQTQLDLDTVEVFPNYCTDDLLRYAAAAFHNLDDERAGALHRACHTRGIAPLDLQPTEFATDFCLLQGTKCIKVGDLGTRAREHSGSKSSGQASPHQTKPGEANSLMVGVDGQVAGLIHFRRSDRLKAASALRRLRSRHNLPVGIISEQPYSCLTSLATSLDTDFQIGGLSPEDRIHFLQNCRKHGFRVAYVGDRHIDPRALAEVHVAISLVASNTIGMDPGPAPICLLQPRITKLAELWEIAKIHRRRLRIAHGYALIPNLICIAGAFAWGFTSLTSVVLTNLGTYCVYSRIATSILTLEHQITNSLKTRESGAEEL